MKALEDLDVEEAHRCMSLSAEAVRAGRSAVEELISLSLDARSAVSLSLALDSLRRVAEYGADIAEVAINLAVTTPTATAKAWA
jgi:phosphate uptake regulator